MLDSTYQWVKRLFVFAYDNTASGDQISVDSFIKYFLLSVKIRNYNIEIDAKKFLIGELMTQLSNTKKSEKCQQDKVMIIQQVLYRFLFWKKITD